MFPILSLSRLAPKSMSDFYKISIFKSSFHIKAIHPAFPFTFTISKLKNSNFQQTLSIKFLLFFVSAKNTQLGKC